MSKLKGTKPGYVEIGDVNVQKIPDDDRPNTRPVGTSGWQGSTRANIKELKPGASMLDAVLPKVYGPNKVPGYMAAYRHWNDWHFVWLFAHGEQTSLDSVTLMDRPIYPNPGGTVSLWWWAIEGVWLGDGTPLDETNLGWILDRYCLTAQEKSDFANYCGIAVRLKDEKINFTGDFKCEAVVGGQEVYDFRDATWKESSNVALVAYDVETDALWKGIPSAGIDTAAGGTWEAFADLCDEEMADASKRYTYNGAITDRDPDKVLGEVLDHGFADIYFNAAGQVCIRHEGPPPALPGTWSATASTTITEDGADDGDATTSLAAGDGVLVGTTFAVVESVTNDNTVVLDRVVTVSGGWLRKVSSVHIQKRDWVRAPTASEVPLASIPDEVIVRFLSAETWEAQQYPAPVDVAGDKRVEVSLSGCRTRTQAKRHSITSQQMAEFQPFSWSGTVGSIGATLEPGMVVRISTNILDEQLVKVDSVRVNYEAGTYQLQLREFDPAAMSDGTEAENTPPTLAEDEPDPPTACTQTFGESGDWDTYTIIANPDDISGWTFDSGLAGSYDGTDDETELTLTDGTVGWKRGYVDVTSDVTDLNVLFVSCMLRWISGVDENTMLNLEYWSGADHASATRQGAIRVTPFDFDGESLWQRMMHRFSLTADAYHELRVACRNVDPTEMTADSVIGLKRLRAVAWGVQGEPIETVYDTNAEHVTARLRTYERWDFTEDASAEDTVAYYALKAPNGSIIGQVEQDGVASLTQDFATTLQRTNGLYWANCGGSSQQFKGADMVAVGLTGQLGYFPVPTQAYEGSAEVPVIGYMIEALAQTEPFQESTTEWSTVPSPVPPYTNSKYDIPEPVWSDYWLELWVDDAGGTDYEIWARAEWPSSVWIGTRTSGHGASQSRSAWPSSGFTYEVRLRHRYTGKVRVLDLANGTTWLSSWLAMNGSPGIQGVPFVTGTYQEIEESVRSAGPASPMVYLQSDSTTSSFWLQLIDLPAYDDAAADGHLVLRVRSRGSDESEFFEDEFYIYNQDEATAAQVKWRSTNMGAATRQYSIQIWRQVDKKDQVWIEAKGDPSALVVESLWLNKNISGYPISYSPDLVLVESDLNTMTTTAPSTGTKGFDSDSETPDVELDLSGPGMSVGGYGVLTLAPGEFNGETEKATPVDDDLVLVEDSAASYGKKKVKLSNLISGGNVPLLIATTSGITTGYPKWIKVMSTATRYAKMIIEFENGLYDITRQWSGRLVVQCEGTASAPVITYTLTAEDSANGVLTVPFGFQAWYDSATGDTEVWLTTLSQHSRVGVRAWTQYHWNTEPNILTAWETDLSSTGPTAAGTYSKVWDQTTATPNFLFDGNGSKIEVDGTPLISRIQDASDVTITGLVWGDMLYWDGSVWRDISRYQIDNNAFHRAASSQISALTEKVTPVSADLIVIEDSAASNAKKKVQIGNLPSGGGGGSAPQTTSAVNLTGTCSTSGSTESTLVNVSSGPYIIHLISNTDGFDSGYIELVVDGTTLIAGYSGGGTLYPPGTVLVGAGSSYFPCPVFVRSSFSIKGLDNGPSFTYRIVYQAVSIS